MIEKIAIEKTVRDFNEDNYPEFISQIHKNFRNATKDIDGDELFTISKAVCDELMYTYLSNIPEEIRQQYNCETCRRFFRNYGGIVTIDDNGQITPVFWHSADSVPGFWVDVINGLKEVVVKRMVERNVLFHRNMKTLGNAEVGGFSHIYVDLPSKFVSKYKFKEIEGRLNGMEENFLLFQRSINAFDLETVKKAEQLLSSDAIKGYFSVKETLTSLIGIYTKIEKVKNLRLKSNILRKMLAIKSQSFAHFKNTTLGTLLENIKFDFDNGTDNFTYYKGLFEGISAPGVKNVPKATPSDESIEVAEKLFTELDLSPSLDRRCATLEDITPYAFWRPKIQEEEKSSGVFGHLKSNNKKEEHYHEVGEVEKITWSKFKKNILPKTMKMWYETTRNNFNSFAGILTATHPEAKPILRWDNLEARNQFSFYGYVLTPDVPRQHFYNLVSCNAWGIANDSWIEVKMIIPAPCHFIEKYYDYPESDMLILDKCKDSNCDKIGNGLLISTLINEVRPVRKVLQAFINESSLSNQENYSACGIIMKELDKGYVRNIKVQMEGIIKIYSIELWD